MTFEEYLTEVKETRSSLNELVSDALNTFKNEMIKKKITCYAFLEDGEQFYFWNRDRNIRFVGKYLMLVWYECTKEYEFVILGKDIYGEIHTYMILDELQYSELEELVVHLEYLDTKIAEDTIVPFDLETDIDKESGKLLSESYKFPKVL
ncbi:MAG: hypothetical protein HPY53_01610 [Brevinematales bacterium]|nr:hypothetical protein [Brevinematales bacterium]